MKISRMKINGMRNPIGFSFEDLRCAWVVTDTEANQIANVKIDAAKDEEFLTVFYTKEGADLNPVCEPLEFSLEPRTRYYVRVQVTDDNGEQARLYISGLGLYSARINGQQVGNEVLTPYFSDYHTEVQYQTFDITALLQKENIIQVELGNSWYKGFFGLDGRDRHFGSEFHATSQ